MKVYLHSDNAERSASYVVTVAPAADSEYAHVLGEMPREWAQPDGTPKQLEVIFVYGVAEIPDGLAAYMIKRGIAHKSRVLRNIMRLFDARGKEIDGIYDETGRPVIIDRGVA